MKRVGIFLDSGAFSAWKQGKEIDLQEYINFIKENKEWITHYTCLDVIRNPEQTWLNQLEMIRQGLNPIVVFHKKENYRWLRKYIRKFEYIGLGGVAGDMEIGETERHLDRCFDIICDQPSRLPKVKVHGFGVTINRLLFKYPWHSADSSTWIMTSRRGIILLPRHTLGKEDYRKPPRRIEISAKSPHKKTEMAHYTTLSRMERKKVKRHVEQLGLKIGVSEFDSEGNETIIERGVCNSFRDRDIVNYWYYYQLWLRLPKKPFPFKSTKTQLFRV